MKGTVTFTNLGRMGRLGNQLFQIAAVIGLAKKTGMDYYFPKWEFTSYTRCDANKFGNILSPSVVYQELDFGYNEIIIPPDFNGILDLFGYFQTDKYFYHIEDHIREIFSPSKDVEEIVNKEILASGITGEFISLHVRRGDYLSQSDYYSILDMDYYKKALGKLPKNLPVLVFSDDPQWISDNFRDDRFILKKRTNQFFNSDKTDFIDLSVMSKGSHFIMANSSYSWWASWLSRNPEKIVVIPNSWFGPRFSGKNTSDIYCGDWIKI